MDGNAADDDIYVDCSDEEKYDFQLLNQEWMPAPSEIIRLYETIDETGMLELEWKCPGRRPVTPVDTETTNPDESESPANEVEEQQVVEKASDFDFEEDVSSLKLAVRPTSDQPKGSAKKKKTTFDAILSNMARHREMDNMPDNTNATTADETEASNA